jgi:hypothetical protein
MKRVLACLLLLPMGANAEYRGDWALEDTVRLEWNTFGGDGQSITRATNGTISWHEDGSTTQSTAGVTDTEDFDGNTGAHLVSIAATAANGFESGKTYVVELVGAVIDGQTVNGGLGTFTIGKTQIAAAAALTAYDPPTNAEMEARTPSAAQLAQLLTDICLNRAVLVNNSDYDDVQLDSAEFENRAGGTTVVTVVYGGANGQDRSVTLGACN